MLHGSVGTRQTGLQLAQLVLCARDVKAWRESILHTFLREAQSPFPDRDIVPQDLLFTLRPAQIHICRCRISGERETQRIDIMLTARQLRLRRQQLKTLAAEYVGRPAERYAKTCLTNIAQRRRRVPLLLDWE